MLNPTPGAFGMPMPNLPGALAPGALKHLLQNATLNNASMNAATPGAPPSNAGSSLQPDWPALMATLAPPPAAPLVGGGFDGGQVQPEGGIAQTISPVPQRAERGLAGFLGRFVNPTNDLGQLGRALTIAGGGPLGTAFQYLDASQREKARDARERERYDQQRQDQTAAQQYERNKPQYFSGNQDRVVFDPVTGASKVLYDAPSDAQDYAESLGLQPGTKEHNDAMRDFVLRGNGPTAFEFRGEIEDQRFGNRKALRSLPTYGDLHRRPPGGPRVGKSDRAPRGTGEVVAPIIAKVARGEPLTPGESEALSYYNRGGRRGGAQAPGGGGKGNREGQTATGPGGHKIVLRSGRWVDQATGRPVR